jgi:hypothetical protein
MMDNNTALNYNIFANIHNLSLVSKAETLINNFLDDNNFIYVQNPDGSILKLQKGVILIGGCFNN